MLNNDHGISNVEVSVEDTLTHYRAFRHTLWILLRSKFAVRPSTFKPLGAWSGVAPGSRVGQGDQGAAEHKQAQRQIQDNHTLSIFKW